MTHTAILKPNIKFKQERQVMKNIVKRKVKVFSDGFVEHFTRMKRENLYEKTFYDYKGREVKLNQRDINAIEYGIYSIPRHY